MNIVLLVVDSLRACALDRRNAETTATPFLDNFSAEASWFRRAYSTECWTLPAHLSIFTGLLPSEHAAHFQTMEYSRPAPTIAELLGTLGYQTEIVTRNFIFDGMIPGAIRGFQHSTAPLAEHSRVHPFALLMAIAKPRFRRHVQRTGFFHPFHRSNREFLRRFAATLVPADDLALGYLLNRMGDLRSARRPYFLFCNLYDVHAPYAPEPHSILRPVRSLSDFREVLRLPGTMATLGAHSYLKPGFRMPESRRQMLIDRYHRSIELMDSKLAGFYRAAASSKLLDDTLLIVTSDHGEAFGEHGLYLHDASVYDVHLHVPLWVRHPEHAPAIIDDIVSTRDLFGLMRDVALRKGSADTILDPGYRRTHPIALAEHFYYPHCSTMADKYRTNQRAAITATEKLTTRGNGLPITYDLSSDPHEAAPAEVDKLYVDRILRQTGVPAAVGQNVRDHLFH